jgi:plasmid stability protein
MSQSHQARERKADGGVSMDAQTLQLHVPGPLYYHLKRRADQAHHSVEDETLDVLATALPATEELPADLSEAVAALSLLDDDALWDAAQSHLPKKAAERMESLHRKRQRQGLTESETQRLETLVHQYERYMLVRAQAAALLKQRGHDVSRVLDKRK